MFLWLSWGSAAAFASEECFWAGFPAVMAADDAREGFSAGRCVAYIHVYILYFILYFIFNGMKNHILYADMP